jgi:hypothetical protein
MDSKVKLKTIWNLIKKEPWTRIKNKKGGLKLEY